MSDRRVSKEELEAFWRGDKDTYQRMYSDRMQQKANEAKRQGKEVTYVPNDGSGTLPEVTTTAPKETEEQKQKRLKQDYENFTDNAITAAGFVPGLDTFSDIADTANQFRQGNWGWGLVGLGALAIPGISSNFIRKGINWAKGATVGKALDLSRNDENMDAALDGYLNQRMRNETSYFSPLKVTNRALAPKKTAGEILNYGTPKDKAKELTGLSMDEVYRLANADTRASGIGHSYRFGDTAPKYLVHQDATGLQPISDTGFVPKREGFIKVEEGTDPEIWYSRFMPYYPAEMTMHPRTIVAQQPYLEQLGHTFDGTHGRYSQVVHSKEELPFEAVEFGLELNPDRKSFNRVKYVGAAKKEPVKAADFSKAQSNIQLLDRMDEFANKYGYPLSDRSTILSNRKTNKQARGLIARHNTYLRGVRPGTADDFQKAKDALGKDALSDLEFMQYAATHSRPPYKGVWISPEENAFIYGGAGNTAYVRRKYQLGKNRNKWFTEGDFEVQTNPYQVGKSWDDAKGIYAPWDNYKEGVAKGPETELISTEALNFAGWADFGNWRQKHRTSLNDRVLNKPDYSIHYWKKGGKL